MAELSKNGLEVLKRRYLAKDDHHNVIETPHEMFQRVAHAVAQSEKLYIRDISVDADSVVANWEKEFMDIMENLDFLPNSPTLMNAGRPLGQLSACFVLPILDSMEGIFGTLKNAAIIHKTGGGTGFSFSNIREEGALVHTTNGRASGPLSFMHAFNAATGTVAQGGCFTGETLIMTNEGPVKIMDLKAGMMVMSLDYSGKVIYTPCTDPFLTRREVSVVSVAIGGDTVCCTPDHPFMVEYKGASNGGGEFVYKKAIELRPGDKVVSHQYLVDDRDKVNSGGKAKSDISSFSDDTTAEVQAVTMQVATRDVWNVEIPGTHNYAVCTLCGSKPRCAQYVYYCTFVSNTRRGANMGMLRVDHPDILKFIHIKDDLKELTNFNLSVAITKEFMDAYNVDGMYDLYAPGTKEIVGTLKAREVFQQIVSSAWKTGEPGIIFIDRINETNFLKPLYGEIEATNPCLAGDTPITILENGKVVERCIDQLVDKEVVVWNGFAWSDVTPRITGYNQKLLTILFSNGRWLRCTPYHKFIMCTDQRKEAKDLVIGDVLAPWALPDSTMSDAGESVYVTNIIDDGLIAEEVYCLNEPKRHAFMANGVVVGNCGEQPLLPYEACNLGSINLANFVQKSTGTFDYDRLAKVVRVAVRFLDDVIDANKYPLPEIDTMCKSTRKIGLGVMGFADALHMMYTAYDSDEGFKMAESIMSLIQKISHSESEALAQERGPYPACIKLLNMGCSVPERRNAEVTTIAPTGSISAIAGVSSGIEPLFSNVFYKHYMDDDYHACINERLMADLEDVGEGEWLENAKKEVMTTGSVMHIPNLPEYIRRTYVCAHDITPNAHVMMQATFQKYTDNAISKTINFGSNATKEDIESVYLMAYKLGCKGITVYRDGCRDTQVLNVGTATKASEANDNIATISFNKNSTPEEFVTFIQEISKEYYPDTPFALRSDEITPELGKRVIDALARDCDLKEKVISLYPRSGDFYSCLGDIISNSNYRYLAICTEMNPMEIAKTLAIKEPKIIGYLEQIAEEEVREKLSKEHICSSNCSCHANDPQEHQMAVRPEHLEGYTKCVKINCGKLYLTVNHDIDQKLFEVFSTNGKGGGCPAQSEATCRLVSLLLRCGIPVDLIIRQIRGIKCTACMKNPNIHVLSCPDAIARELEDYQKQHKLNPTKMINGEDITTGVIHVDQNNQVIPEAVEDAAKESWPVVGCDSQFTQTPDDFVLLKDKDQEYNPNTCPQCGAPMIPEGGCRNCPKCGYSSCG